MIWEAAEVEKGTTPRLQTLLFKKSKQKEEKLSLTTVSLSFLNQICIKLQLMVLRFDPTPIIFLLVQFLDSVEEGEKIVKTAIDNFGRVG